MYPLNLVVPLLRFWKILVTCFITDLPLFKKNLLIHSVLSWTYQRLSGLLLYFLIFYLCHFAPLPGRFSQLCLPTHLLTFLFLRSYFLIFRSLFKPFECFSLKSLQFLFHLHNIFISLRILMMHFMKFSIIVFVLFRVFKNCYFVSVFRALLIRYW